MSATLATFSANPSDVLQIAIRGQHIARWTIARAAYPMDRAGYFAWRNALKAMHAMRLSDIMGNAGYDEAERARVGQIVRKERLKADPEAQILEDVACLVFLEFYANPFFAKHSTDKMVDILTKTWRKMSPMGHKAAGNLPFIQENADLAARVIGSSFTKD